MSSLSSISEIGELASKEGAIDLALGTPEDQVDGRLMAAVTEGMRLGWNQYSTPVGIPGLVTALRDRYSLSTAPQRQGELGVCVTCGATEAITCALMASLNIGDEVILIEPFYDGYLRIIERLRGVPRAVPLTRPGWDLDVDALADAVNQRTRVIIVNSPHNPTGRVFSRTDLELVGNVIDGRPIICISDEVYDEFYYGNEKPISPSSVESLSGLTLRVGSLSKMFGVTGWRLGWVVGPAGLMRNVVDCHLAVSAAAPTPMQYAAAVSLGRSEDYLAMRRRLYLRRRDLLYTGLKQLHFDPCISEGAFYLMSRIPSAVPRESLMSWFIQTAKVAVVPMELFTLHDQNSQWVRFAFCKSEENLTTAISQLRRTL